MTAPLLVLAALAQAPTAPAQDSVPVWRVDLAHSEVSFRIRHLMSRVRGTFRQWEGRLHADPANWATGRVQVTIDASSIFTDHDRRDADLRSDNFFDVARFPTLTFVSRSVEAAGERLRVHGDLTIKGTTRPVVLETTFLGRTPDGSRVGFEATTTINRLDYGVTWNRAVEGGGLLLGDDVEITISLQAVRI